MSKGLQIAIGALTVFAGVALLLTLGSSGEGTFQYYTSVSEYAAAPGTVGRASRVHGFVLEGSIAKDLPAGHVDFVIRDAVGGQLPVRLLGIEVPDLFADGAEVVVEGHHDGVRFAATQVLAKCPSKYEAEAGAARPKL